MRTYDSLKQPFDILDSIPMGAFILQKDLVVLFWNKQLEEWTRLPRKEILGSKIDTCYPHLGEPQYYSRIQTVFEDMSPVIFSSQLHKQVIPSSFLKDGALQIQKTTITPLTNKEDGEIYALFVIEDVTEITHRIKVYQKAKDQALKEIEERKATEKALEKSEERFNLVLKAADIGTWDWNMQSGEVIFDEPWVGMLGYSLEEIKPHYTSWEKLIYPNDAPEVMKTLNAHLEGQTSFYEAEFRLKTKSDKWLWILARGKVIERDEDGKAIRMIGTHLDITNRKLAEESLQQRFEELAKARKASLNMMMDLERTRDQANTAWREAERANQAKSEFLANMSHEIRTPMNAILGFAEILTAKVKSKENQHYLSSIVSSGKTLLTLINDILDLSKVEAGKLSLKYSVVDIQFILEDMQNIFSQKVDENNVNFIMDIDRDLPKALLLDETRLRQILLNVIGNAVKFTESGYIKLTVQIINPNKDKSKLDLKFSVKDTGIGIADDQKEAIFESFRQQKDQDHSRYGGTGLGLAITKRLVEMMDGEIILESELGKGSIFSVILHDIDVSSVIEKKKDTGFDSSTIHFDEAKILIVDDIKTNRMLLKGYLNDYKLTLLEAKNGKDAVDMAKKFLPDLILMDLKMPVMGGYEASEILKSHPETQSIPIVIITATVREDIEKLIPDRCDGYLRKPTSKSQVIQVLARFLSHSIQKKAIKTPSEGNIIPMTPEIMAKLPELMTTLEGDMTDIWKNVSDVLNISHIKDFADKIMNLAAMYHYQPMELWAKELVSQLDIYDTEGITKTLSRFPGLIESIKASLTSDQG